MHLDAGGKPAIRSGVRSGLFHVADVLALTPHRDLPRRCCATGASAVESIKDQRDDVALDLSRRSGSTEQGENFQVDGARPRRHRQAHRVEANGDNSTATGRCSRLPTATSSSTG
jgi:hypothetical protein